MKLSFGQGLLLAAALIALAPSAARADDVQKIVQLNKKAVDDYDILEFESAKKSLLEAINIGKKAGLENHQVMARTYIHLGVVYINGFKDRFKGFQQFQKAIQIQADVKLDKNLQTPELQEVFDSALDDAKSKGLVGSAKKPAAKKPADDEEEDEAPAPKKPVAAAKPAPKAVPKKPAGGGDEEEDEEDAPKAKKGPKAGPAKKAEPKVVEIEEPDLPASVPAMECPNNDEAPPEKDILLRCAVNPGLNVSTVFLYYREPGKEDFTPVPMVKSKKGWYNGVVPGKVVVGKSLQYYFEGRDKGGKAVVAKGRNDSPELIIIREGAKEMGKGATAILDAQKAGPADTGPEIEENPLEEKKSTGPKVVLGAVKKKPSDIKRNIGDRKFWIGLSVGSGFGFAKGNGPEARKDLNDQFKPGLAWAGLGQAVPEFGWYLNPNLAVSIEGRHQYIPQPSSLGTSVARGAHMGMLRALYFNEVKADRFFGSVMLGGGEGFRLNIHPDQENNPNFKDTVLGGFLVGGVGAGFTHDFNPDWALVVEANALVGAPSLSAVLDVNVGFQMGF